MTRPQGAQALRQLLPVRLAAATWRSWRQEGLWQTCRRVAYWLYRRVRPADASPLVPVPACGFEVAYSYDPGRLTACGPIDRSSGLLQEIPVHFDELHSIEVLLATYTRPNTNTTTFALLAPDGRCLASTRVRSSRVRDNAFTRVAVEQPLRVAEYARLYLWIHSEDGSAGNAITAWTSPSVRGRLWRTPAVTSEQALRNTHSSEPSALGSLVYRLTARNRLSEPRYRWPNDVLTPLERREVHVIGAAPLAEDVPSVRTSDVTQALAAIRTGSAGTLVLGDVDYSEAIAALIVEAMQGSVPTVCFASAGSLIAGPGTERSGESAPGGGINGPRRKTMVACDLVVAEDAATAAAARADHKLFVREAARIDLALLRALDEDYRLLRLPRVSIVTILYNKERELPAVLASWERQTYPGALEIVCVDDCSPDRSADVVTRFAQRAPSRAAGPLEFKLVRNGVNSGNCVSRNRGIEAATGEILIVIDADCMLNRDFVARHVDAHAFGDCDIVIGPYNIETGAEDPAAVLQRFEEDPALALDHCELQDRGCLTSFLNCITRNFSIRRRALLDEALFDPLFGYSADPKSGFGWEDVEMGYRLYAAGRRIKFVAEAFSIHVSAPPGPEGDKPARSLRNFLRLLQKHPDLAAVAPAWTRTTGCRILEWADRLGVDVGYQRAELEALIGSGSAEPLPVVRTRRRPLRVLTYRWHVAHQYELWKLPIDVTLATGTGSGMCDRWEYGQRPLPRNARFRPLQEIDPREFDLAILHFDENVLAPENTNGVIGPEWGAAFRLFRDMPDVRKIAVCHGTPQFRGQYDIDYREPDLLQTIEPERKRLVDYLGDIMVVCNSHQAQREWQFRRSTVIWHGFDPREFPPATYERGVLSPLGPLVLSRPHYRGYFLYRQVFDGLYDVLRPETLHVPDPHPSYVANAHAYAKFRRYVDEIRRYSVYFNPTQRSPMPRARGEPMMCGVVTVSARNHDVDLFIENGVDGFHAVEADELRDQLLFLQRHPDAVRRIGQAGRRKAMQVFHIDRYLAEWRALIAAECGVTLPAGH